MRGLSLILSLSLCVAPAAFAQENDQTLADIRQEMSVLYVEIQRLKRELSTTGAASGVATGGSVLQRVDALEAQLTQLTARTEDLQYRIDSIVTDGTNRLGDLEFRLCELEAGCDIGQLGETSTLGGGDLPTVVAPAIPPVEEDTAELAIGERADFEAASQALADGAYRAAADQFARFVENYPGGPLTSEAHYMRGEALGNLGETAPAARAYLESFSGAPRGSVAPEALYKLGLSLAVLGQMQEACVTLGEVEVRFPAAPVAASAQDQMGQLGCQ